MKKLLTQVIAILLLLAMLAGMALAASDPAPEPSQSPEVSEEPVGSELVESDPVESDPVESDPVESDPVESDPVESDPVESDPVESDPVESDPVESDPVESDPVETEPVESEPVESEPVESEPVEPSDPPVEPSDPPVEPSDPPVEPSDPPVVEEPTGPVKNPELAKTIIRVGLRYNKTVMDGANIGNSIGSGFYFGYYSSSNQFVSLGSYTGTKTLSVVKTENVYYGTYNGYTSYYDHLTNSSVGVGCYHLQVPGSYSSFDGARNAANQYNNGFVAYIGGTYYVRIGNYLHRDDAVAAQANLAASGISTELKGTSSYGLSVVIKGTNTIVFQYDDNGNGTGLGLEPISVNGQKCVTWFDGVEYYGGFRYERIDGGDLTIVNMIQLDDYVKGVVCREMVVTWPLEALKAQAVAARSYVLHNQNNHKKYHFDACTSTHCQVYGGREKATANTDEAVDSTQGIVARYNGQVINAVFYSSNGGASEASSTVWGSSQSKFPYLIGVEDPYEATIESKISGYNWTRQYTGDQLAAVLRDAGYTSCSTVVSVRIDSYTATGNPAAVTFVDSNGRSFRLTARAMIDEFGFRSWRYELADTTETIYTVNDDTTLDDLSGLYVLGSDGSVTLLEGEAYVINSSGEVTSADAVGNTVTGDVFTFAGKGFGHNVGLSQYGAYAMAELGYTYDEILMFYYTGITVG